MIPIGSEIKEKTHFVIKGNLDPLLAETIEDFGEIHSIETSGFAQACRNFLAPSQNTDLTRLKSLKIVDTFKDAKAILPPTLNEILDLIAFGKFNERRCLGSLPEATYISPRNWIAERVDASLRKHNTIVIHSRLGNGKTIALWSVAHYLLQRGYRCFRCTEISPTLESDIASLTEVPKIAILFDSYDVAIACVDRFVEVIPSVKIIVCARTGLQQVRMHEIFDKFPGPVSRIDINNLTSEDKYDLTEILERMGTVKENLGNRIMNASDMREIVTVIYDNTYVRSRIDEALKPIIRDPKALAAIITSLLMTWIGHPADVSMFIQILDSDPFQLLSKHKEEISDIFDLRDDIIQARSSVFAEYLLQKQFSIDQIMIIIERVLVVAAENKNERKYRTILSNLMSFGQLSRIFRSHSDASAKIRELYGRLQRDVDIRKEPLFWLQYTIAMIDDNRLDIAEGFLITAYREADNNPGFETYQLDTQSLRLNLMIEANIQNGQDVKRITRIMKNLHDIESMISNVNHRNFAIRVLENVRPFIEHRLIDIRHEEKIQLRSTLERLSISLDKLSPGARAESGADFISADLRSLEKLL